MSPSTRAIAASGTSRLSSGGLWKTTNRGLTFQPIFDEGGSYSLGCVTARPEEPRRGLAGHGRKPGAARHRLGRRRLQVTDGGKTWKNMGLRHSEHIAKILVDPRDSNVVLVASQGPLFSAGGDRGLFKTTDGGQTWKPILQISPDTGVTDLAVDPRNPDVMYAASYQRRRVTSIVIAGGPESGDLQDDRRRRSLDQAHRGHSRGRSWAASRSPSRRRSPTSCTPRSPPAPGNTRAASTARTMRARTGRS